MNSNTTKEIFPLIKDNKIWLGYGFKGGAAHFISKYNDTATASDHRDGMIRVSGVHWFTNLETKKRHENIILYRTYNPKNYPHYDNYDAIEVCKTEDIPYDYYGIMGVPVTFLDKYNPDQFEILGITKTWFGMASKTYGEQIQVDKNGKESRVTKLNDGAVLEVQTPPLGKTYYKVDGKIYIQTYPRILIRKIKK